MPAEQGHGGRKALLFVGMAIVVGVAIGVLAVVSKTDGAPKPSDPVLHDDHSSVLHRAEGEDAGSRLVATADRERHHGRERDEARDEAERLEREDPQEDHQKVHHEREHPEQNRSSVNNRTSDHNQTEERSHSKEHNHTKEHEHDHVHKKCVGGPLAACECMMECEVFGGNTSKCSKHNHTETRQMVDNLIMRTLLSHRSMCDGMKCVMDCATQLGCLDAKVTEDCSIVRETYAANKLDSDPECDLTCDA